MLLSQVLAQEVSSQARVRGHSYFTSGAVRSLTVEQGVVHATVRGSDNYIVWIESDGPRLEASCSCPYFFDRIEICKHIWAVILAAEAQSLLLVPPGTRTENVYLEPLYPEDEDDFDEDRDASSWRHAPPPRVP